MPPHSASAKQARRILKKPGATSAARANVRTMPGKLSESRGAIRARRPLLAVTGLVAASAVLRALASRGVPTPWIAPDETIYGLLGQGLYRHGSLTILGGPTPFYSVIVPALVGAPLSLGNLALGFTLLKALQALVMSLAAVPAYLWARTLVARRWALVAAALTVALPALAYSGLVMSEVAFYPLFTLAAWATAAVVERPTRRRQLLFLLAASLALATRLQAVVLAPILVTALLLDAGFARRRPRLRPLVPSFAGMALAASAWIGWRLASGSGLLAAYGGAAGSYPIGRAAEFVGWHAGDLVLLCGVLPAAALLVLLGGAIRGAARAEREASACLAVTAAAALWLVAEVGVFAAREVDGLAERNLIVAAPPLFVVFAVWLDRGGPGSSRARLAAGCVAAGSVLALPLGRFVTPAALPDAFSLIPLYHLRQLTSLDVVELAVGLSVAAAAAGFALARGRGLALLAAALLLVLAGGSVASSREVTAQARAQQLRLVGPERRWIDAAARGPVAYVYDGQAWWNAVWENAFWNRQVRWVYDLPGTSVPGPLPQQPLSVSDDGELRPDGSRSPARYAVIPLDFTLRGTLVARSPQLGTDRQGLGLWRLDPPLAISTITSGLFANGDVDVEAALAVYGCRAGTFDAVFLVKEPQTVDVFLDGRRVVRRHFAVGQTWELRLAVHATAAGADRICRLRVDSDGLLGTTRFAFDRT
jgi:hypothetical protein